MPVRSADATSFVRPKAKTRDLRFTLKIKAKPERVYKALTSATELCRWWLQGAETDARNSGRFRMVWPKLRRLDGDDRERVFPPSVAMGDSEGFFVDLEPGRKVAWMWRPLRKLYPPLSSFFIAPAGRGSEVMLLHCGFSSSPSANKYFQGCAEGWEDCLAKLKLYLETGRTLKSQTLTFGGLEELLRGETVTIALTVLLAVMGGAAIAGVVFYLIFFSARKNEEAQRIRNKEELRGLLELAEQKFATERVRQQSELDERRQAVETAVGKLSEQLKAYEQLMKSFEGERREKYGSLEKTLKDASETTGKLAQSTESLRALLDNSRARGQWGERMADDILRASGMKENVQYLKNRAQDTVATRPDFTFLLPDNHKLHMDVKFPLDNYLRLVNAQADEERARHKNEFLKDVKARIKEIQKRDYINPSEQTLDYVLLFIPNEQVYGFIHEACPGLIDEALSQKVVLCSPFTLYAVLAVIRQSFDNFHFAQATQEVLKLIATFAAAYDRFRERFADFGEKLAKLEDLYHDISGKSFKQLDLAIAKIEKVRHGQLEAEDPPPAEADKPGPLPLPLRPGSRK